MKNEIIVQKLMGYTEKIIGYCGGVSYEQFSADSKLAEACVFNLSQMGELANRVDGAFAAAESPGDPKNNQNVRLRKNLQACKDVKRIF